jgi:hypothetical protein
VIGDTKAGGCADVYMYSGKIHYVVQTVTQVHDAIEALWQASQKAESGVDPYP